MARLKATIVNEVSAIHTEAFDIHRRSLDHFLKVARTLIRARSAVVMLNCNGISRSIAHLGLVQGNVTLRWSHEESGIPPNKFYASLESETSEMGRSAVAIFGPIGPGLHVRAPVLANDVYSAAILMFEPAPAALPSKNEILLLRGLAKMMAEDVEYLTSTINTYDQATSILASYQEMIAAVESGPGIRGLLTRDLKVAACSKILADRLGENQQQIRGKSYFDLKVQYVETMARLFSNAFESGISTPEIELTSEASGIPRKYIIRGTPIFPQGASDRLLDISMIETTNLRTRTAEPAGSNGEFPLSVGERSDNHAVVSFLAETLLRKRAIKARGPITYVTIRSWRNSLKEYQIKAFRAIKKSDHQDMAEIAGEECAREIKNLVGTAAFKFVVPMPCGHSKAGSCFSHSLAMAVAAQLKLPMINAFKHMAQKGSSHPKTNVGRPKMKLVQQVPGPALLIDDVSTSGAHIAEAVQLLRDAGSEVFAVAWIGSEADR